MNPPQVTPKQRLQHFMATVEDYESLDRAFPLSRLMDVRGYIGDEPSRWTVITHSMLIRKYFQTSDKLHLTRVMRTLRAATTDGWQTEKDWDDLEANVPLLEAANVFHVGGRTMNESEVLEQQLYGRYLHGDYEKWANEPDQYDRDYAAFSATMGRISRVKGLHEFIHLAIEENALDLSDQQCRSIRIIR